MIRWRTATPTSTALWLGASPGNLTVVRSDPIDKTGHEVLLTGLTPDTEYFYAVGDDLGMLFGGDQEHRFRTSPVPGSPRPTRIWVIGDFGFGSPASRAVRDAYLAFAANRDTDVWLTTGDNAYPDGTDVDLQRGLFNTYPTILSSTFLWPSFGNHDGISADSETETGVYYDAFTLPRQGEAGGLPSGTEAFYSFDHGNIHFISLDSDESDRSSGGVMMTWLAADLANTSADWIIAYWHHAPYSDGQHDSDRERRMTEMREIAVPILEAGGVDLVLTGHSHSYERSYLLDGHYDTSDTLLPAMKMDCGDGRELGDGAYVKPGVIGREGTVYAVVGSSGILTPGPLQHPAMSVSLLRLGSMVIDIDGDRLDARFLDSAGNIADEFTILKGITRSLTRDAPRVSLSTGGTQNLFLDAGQIHAQRQYLLALGDDTSPGLDARPAHLPLNRQDWSGLVPVGNHGAYRRSGGWLDRDGRARVTLTVPAWNEPSLIGRAFYHAFAVIEGTSLLMASNPVKLTSDL